MYVRQNALADIRRVWSVGGPPFVPYAGGDGSVVNFGVDVGAAAALAPIPVLSDWGVIALMVLLLTAGILVLMRRGAV
jgi:hypothetical protein